MNGIISSCQSDSCSFEFKESASITSVSPITGFGDESALCQHKVEIACNGCGTILSDIEVYFGSVEAKVESILGDIIVVCPGSPFNI